MVLEACAQRCRRRRLTHHAPLRHPSRDRQRQRPQPRATFVRKLLHHEREPRDPAMNDIDILVTAPLPPFLSEPLKTDYRCHDYAQAGDKPALLAQVAPRVRGLVQGGGTVTPTSLLDALPALEIISVFGVGYDGVPTDYCRTRGIKVTNTPDVLTDDVADIAVALILMTGRGLARANRFVQAGEWLRRGPELTTKLGGRSVGILGLGRIGKAIAERVTAMQMSVAYTGRKPQPVPYRFVDNLGALAAGVDFLVVACPGGPATRHLVDAAVLKALGPDGTLINIARGSIVDEAALVDALSNRTIKAAGLDVFDDEPNIPQRLLALDNAVLLPHVGSATRETRQAMGDLCKANLDQWFSARSVLTLVPELA
jgi:lactate dehydrogenase-like 2-hydroxyacid dehydrogenase